MSRASTGSGPRTAARAIASSAAEQSGAAQLTRRRLLGATGLAAGTALLPEFAQADPGSRSGIAIVTDTHASVDTPGRTERLRRVMTHIESRKPSCVLNCGDITEYGAGDEFAEYRSTVPDALWPLLHHAPGNHEGQWNADLFEAYREWFGPTRHSFDADGIHFVGIDPLVSQEWSWHIGDDLIDWIEDDLRRQHPSTPVVIFNHFPMASKWHYIKNAERFFPLLRRYPVRMLFAGHSHQLQVTRFNGTTQLVGEAIKNEPIYYWARRGKDDHGAPTLTVAQVQLLDDGSATEETVAVTRLSEPASGAELGPLQVDTTVRPESVSLRVGTADPAAAVIARLYPQGARPDPWQQLTRTGNSWSTDLALTRLPPGQHRIALRATGADDSAFDDVVGFELTGSGPSIRWTRQLEGRIQADLAAHRGLVVAGTVAGQVAAFDVREERSSGVWTRRVGAVHRGVSFSPDGATVYVGSADHHLYALAADSGQTRWKYDVGAPVAADLLVGTIGGRERIVVAAGHRLHCLTPDGELDWSADLGGSFAGQPATDGDRVFAASSVSDALAFDGHTGDRLWATRLTDVSDAYHRILNGPWAARIRLSPAGEVLIPTVTKVLKLDPATGAVQWSVEGIRGSSYTPPIVTDHGLLTIEGGTGIVRLLDFATGAIAWTDHTLPRSRGAGPVRTQDPDVLLMTTNTSALVRIDLGQRTITPLLQVGRAFTLSTGVLVDRGGDRLMISGDKDGRLTAVTV